MSSSFPLPKEIHLAQAGLAQLPSDWSIIELQKLLSVDRGISVGVMYPGKHDPFGVPLIKVGSVKNGMIDPDPEFRITAEKHNEYHRTALEGGELLITLVGNVGQCAIVPPEMKGWNAARAIAVLRLKNSKDVKFVRFCLLSNPLQHLMNVWATTTVQATLNLKEIKQLPLPWPPLSERDSISNILETIEKKIELNRQINETLEAIARALFKSWFVDFDPVRAKMEGRQPFGMDEELAKLLPDSLTDSELGNIPYKWNTKPLSSCVSYLSRGVAPKYVTSSPIRALNQRAIRWGYIDETALKFHDPGKTIREEAHIRRGDVVINSTGDGTIGRAYWFHHNVTNLFADSHVSIVRTLPEVLYPELLVFYMETELYQSIIYGHVTGSTGQLELNRSNP